MKKICAKILSGFVLGVVAVMVSLLAMSVGTGAKTKVVTTKNGTKLCCYTSDGNNYEIYEIKNAKKDLIIPETVDGKHKITSFYSQWCEKVEYIHFPSGMKKLPDMDDDEGYMYNIFHNFPNLKEVSFDARNQYYSAKDGKVYSMQGKKKELAAVVPGISHVTVESEVTSLRPEAFRDLTKLENIFVEKGNKKYKSIKGVLYSKDGKNLICYPIAKKDEVFRMPDGVKKVCQMACYDQKYLKKIIMGSSVHEIREYAFAGCARLKKVSLNKNLKILKQRAFDRCNKWLDLSLPKGIEEVEIGSLKVKKLEIPAGCKKVRLDVDMHIGQCGIWAKTLIVRSRSLNMIAMDQECWYDAEIDEDDLEESVYKGKTIYAYKDSKAYKQLKPVAEIYGIKLKLLKG